MTYAAAYWLKVWTVWAYLLAQPVCYREPQQPNRLLVIAQAVTAVSETQDDLLGLLTIGHFESQWCERVHAGRVRGGDGRGLWQLEPGSHRPGPYAGLSLAETTNAALQARWLWRHSRQCGPGLEDRFSAYAGLSLCRSDWSGASARANFYALARQQLFSK